MKVLNEHPSVKSGILFGSLNPKGKYEIEAAVVLKPKHKVLESSINQWLMSFFPIGTPFKIHFVNSLPTTSQGKIQRHKAINRVIQARAKL